MSVPTDFCDECKSSVYLDDKKIDVHAIEDRHRRLQYVILGTCFNEAEPHYQRRDDAPNLSRLRAGAEAGCRFCRSLRHEILKKNKSTSSWRDHPDDITLSFSYAWIVDYRRNNGVPSLDQLLVKIYHPSLSMKGTVYFDVYNSLRKYFYYFCFQDCYTRPPRFTDNFVPSW